MVITAELVQNLIAEQFPQWKDLPVRPVEKSGHDNRTFHLGDAMSVRLPSGKAYEAQVQKESRWLPYLQAQLDYPISAPLAVGRPCAQYPYFWSVNRWIEGCTLRDEAPADRTALDKLRERLPVDRLAAVWDRCIAEPYTGGAVWVHGDVAPGNILLRERRFCGLIDFGILGTGDPACDYAMAWTYFSPAERDVFLRGLDCGAVARARGWALWKALITYDDSDADFRENARHTVREILKERG